MRDTLITQETYETVNDVCRYFERKLKNVGCDVSVRGLNSTASIFIYKENYDSLSTKEQIFIDNDYLKTLRKFFKKTKIEVSPVTGTNFLEIKPTQPFEMSFVSILRTAKLFSIHVIPSMSGYKKVENNDCLEVFIEFSDFFAATFRYGLIMKYFRDEKWAKEFLISFKTEMIDAINLIAKAIRLSSV